MLLALHCSACPSPLPHPARIAVAYATPFMCGAYCSRTRFPEHIDDTVLTVHAILGIVISNVPQRCVMFSMGM
jgi:hypothetical protein